jgi:hypothetical protein
MKTAITILTIFSFLLACGQINQVKSVSIESAKGKQEENDIGKLWKKEVESRTFFKQIDETSIELKNLDISTILTYNDTVKNEVPGHFSTYTGALGKNFERIDFHFYSVNKVENQDYNLMVLMRKGTGIDTLIGHLKLTKAFEFPELFSNENMKAMTFFYDFSFASKKTSAGLTINGTSSVSFFVSNGIAGNFWMEDCSFREYIRTFVGYYTDSKSAEKLNCVFALDVAGLYSHLPFCDDFYYQDEKNYSPDYYLIKEKYRQFGWQDYNYNNPNNDQWWRE